MTRIGHFLISAAASLPVLGVTIVATSSHHSARAWGVFFWLAAVGLTGEILWRRSQKPVNKLIETLGLNSVDQVPHRVHELQDEARRCHTERANLAQLVDDISTGLGEGLMVIDSELHLRLVNPRAQQFLGVESITLGASFLDLERDPDLVAGIRGAVAGEAGRRIVVENSRGVWEVRPFPLSQAGAVVLMTEVGSLRRTAELRRRFVQDLSHEVRSPLAVMRTTVEALEDEVSPDIARMMVRQVERIARLTDELYELASIEAGTLKMNPSRQSILSVARQVVSDFTSVAARAEIDLRVEAPEDLAFDFDRRALTRVLSNLVDNAIKYNRAGGFVTIAARTGDDAVHIEVEDSGQGIPASELGAVMQRFYRVDRARTPGTGGLGLGLAIVKHMVQQMGGDLKLDSREDVGTRVVVTFPTK